jgi:hypothetical protein
VSNKYWYNHIDLSDEINTRKMAQRVVYLTMEGVTNKVRSKNYTTAGWSSGLWSRLRNQRSRVRILVVSRGFSLCAIHKEGLCPSSRDINRLMMMMMMMSRGYCDEQLHLVTRYGCLYT